MNIYIYMDIYKYMDIYIWIYIYIYIHDQCVATCYTLITSNQQQHQAFHDQLEVEQTSRCSAASCRCLGSSAAAWRISGPGLGGWWLRNDPEPPEATGGVSPLPVVMFPQVIS